MRCINCGTEIIDETVKFCIECGAEISKKSDKKISEEVDFFSGKTKILFNVIFGEYCKNGLRDIESHNKIKQKASVLDINSEDLEEYVVAFLKKVEKVNMYIAELCNDEQNELSEEEEAYEIYLFASDYGFNEEQVEQLIDYNRMLRVAKVLRDCEEKKLRNKLEHKVEFLPITVAVKHCEVFLPGINKIVKTLYETAVEILCNYQTFEKELKKTANLSYSNVRKVSMKYFDSPFTKFYETLENNNMFLGEDKGGIKQFREDLYAFEDFFDDEQYVKENRREVLDEFFETYRNVIDMVIKEYWDAEYVGFMKCVENHQKEKKYIEELKNSRKGDEEKANEIVSYIGNGAYYPDTYIYLAEILRLTEEEEIDFLENIQQYVVDGKNNTISIKTYLNQKYNLNERRSVADIVLLEGKTSTYSDGALIEYSSDVEAIEARKQREVIKDIYENIDYSSNKTFYPSLRQMEHIYEKTGLGAALIEGAKNQCESQKILSDLTYSKKKGLIDDTKKISFKTLEDASEARVYKQSIIQIYNECAFNSDAEVQEAISKIDELYEKSKLGKKVLEHSKLRYQLARSVQDVVVNESGEVVANGEPFVCNTIQERNSIQEELDKAIQLFAESRKNNYVNVEQVYEQVKSIVEQIELGQSVLTVLVQEVEKKREKLVIYDYTTNYKQGIKKRSVLSKGRVEKLCESEEAAKEIQKLIDSIAEIYQNCDLTNCDSLKNAIEKVQIIYNETQCGKSVLDELLYRCQEIDKARLLNQEKLIYDETLAATSSYMIYETAILEELIKNLEEKNFQSKDIIEDINELKSKLLVLKEHEATEHYKKGEILKTLFDAIGDSLGICLYGKPGFVESSMIIAKEKALLSKDMKTYFPILMAGTWYDQEAFFKGLIITDEYIAVLGYLMVTDQKVYLNTLKKIKVSKNKIELHSDDKIIKFKMSEEIAIGAMLDALAQHLKIVFEINGVQRDYSEKVSTNTEVQKVELQCENSLINNNIYNSSEISETNEIVQDEVLEEVEKAEESSKYNNQAPVVAKEKNKQIQQEDVDIKCSNWVPQKTMQTEQNMKKRRFLVYLLLTFLTCGIYSLYFWYRYTEDVNEICDGDGKKSPNYIVVVLLSCITLGIYSIYWRYAQTNRLYKAGLKYKVPIRERGVSIVLLYLVSPFIYFISIYVAQYIMINIVNRFVNVEL